MITTITFILSIFVSVVIGIYMGILIKPNKKDKGPNYEKLYKESAKRLKVLLDENLNHSSVVATLSEQLNWHKILIEHVVMKYEISEDDLYKLVKGVNDSLGIDTPTKEEMEEKVEEVMKAFGMDEELEMFRERKKQKTSDVTKMNLDSILEKISISGVESLSQAEKDFLNDQK